MANYRIHRRSWNSSAEFKESLKPFPVHGGRNTGAIHFLHEQLVNRNTQSTCIMRTSHTGSNRAYLGHHKMAQSSKCLIAYSGFRVIENIICHFNCLSSEVVNVGIVRRVGDHSKVASGALQACCQTEVPA
jgi:hypothetical protein